MTAALLILGAAFALALSAISSGAETGVYCLNRVRLRVRAERGEPAARRLARLMDRPEDLVITTLAGTNVADYLASACVAALLIHVHVAGSLAEMYATAILTPLILVFGGIIPKDWFQRESDVLMTRVALPLYWGRRVLAWTGLIALLRWLTHALLRRIDPARMAHERKLLPRARMHRMLIEGAARGGLSDFQRETIERIMEMSQMRLADIMVRRERAATVPIDIPRDDLLRIARMAHFSRLPVYESSPRRIVGIVNVYDVLMDRHQRPVADYVRDAVALRSDETVPTALRKLQRARQVIAVVQDEHGECLGLFTMKDLVECIVGELKAW